MSLALKTARVQAVGPGIHSGGLFSAIGGFVKKAASVVAPIALGPLGNVASAAINALGGRSADPRQPNLPLPIIAPPSTLPSRISVPTAPALPPAFGPPTQVKNGQGYVTSPAGTKIPCPKGFHPNKSAYYTMDGQFHPVGSKCVRDRSRNPLNPRALRRAVARIDAGKAWQAKLAEISTKKYTASGKRRHCD